MPAIAYGLASALGMKGDALLGLSLVACTPGESMSNVFSYFSRGNMALSIALTLLSNLLAFGTMPLALTVLAPDSRVPFTEIIKTLALTIGPTAAGIALKTWRALGRKARSRHRWYRRRRHHRRGRRGQLEAAAPAPGRALHLHRAPWRARHVCCVHPGNCRAHQEQQEDHADNRNRHAESRAHARADRARVRQPVLHCRLLVHLRLRHLFRMPYFHGVRALERCARASMRRGPKRARAAATRASSTCNHIKGWSLGGGEGFTCFSFYSRHTAV
ncbi:sodium bile acid symporter family-domain-containing protein [Pavlovales sp. CCMP2436]|nr:sodium bile acid symporter family-domain-containing protein [Pavlovales sp. CCMP2436]